MNREKPEEGGGEAGAGVPCKQHGEAPCEAPY